MRGVGELMSTGWRMNEAVQNEWLCAMVANGQERLCYCAIGTCRLWLVLKVAQCGSTSNWMPHTNS